MTAVIYARVSSTGERQSTERQVKDLSDYALYKKMKVCQVLEEHVSGAKQNEKFRPGFEDVLLAKECKTPAGRKPIDAYQGNGEFDTLFQMRINFPVPLIHSFA